MSNQWCHICGGLVDHIGLQPQDVRLCACGGKIAKFRARIAELEAERAVAIREVSEWARKAGLAEARAERVEAELAAARAAIDDADEYLRMATFGTCLRAAIDAAIARGKE